MAGRFLPQPSSRRVERRYGDDAVAQRVVRGSVSGGRRGPMAGRRSMDGGGILSKLHRRSTGAAASAHPGRRRRRDIRLEGDVGALFRWAACGWRRGPKGTGTECHHGDHGDRRRLVNLDGVSGSPTEGTGHRRLGDWPTSAMAESSATSRSRVSTSGESDNSTISGFHHVSGNKGTESA